MGHFCDMKQMSVHDAKAHFSAIIKEVEAGENIIITRHDKPVVELRSVADRPIPVIGAFGDPNIPHADVSWTEGELDEFFANLLKPGPVEN